MSCITSDDRVTRVAVGIEAAAIEISAVYRIKQAGSHVDRTGGAEWSYRWAAGRALRFRSPPGLAVKMPVAGPVCRWQV